MKKLLAILLVFAVCLGLCACGGKAESKDPVKNIEAQKADELILAIGDVSLESEANVLAAQAYYDTLTEEQKAAVLNAETLANALATIEALKIEEQYNIAVAYEDEKNPMAAKAIYEKLPADYADVAERIATIEGFLLLEGTWVCDNVNMTGSDGKTYKPRFDRYDVFIIPGWTVALNGENKHYGRGILPFESATEAITGIQGFNHHGIWRNEDGLFEVGGYGLGGEMNGGFQGLEIKMYFDAEKQSLKVVYTAGYSFGSKDVTVEYTYHKQ